MLTESQMRETKEQSQNNSFNVAGWSDDGLIKDLIWSAYHVSKEMCIVTERFSRAKNELFNRIDAEDREQAEAEGVTFFAAIYNQDKKDILNKLISVSMQDGDASRKGGVPNIKRRREILSEVEKVFAIKTSIPDIVLPMN